VLGSALFAAGGELMGEPTRRCLAVLLRALTTQQVSTFTVVVGVSFIRRFRLRPLMGTRQERPGVSKYLPS
jgi:hypothetical protein